MDVLPAGRATPDNVLLGLELAEADGAVALDGLAVVGLSLCRVGGVDGGRVGEDEAELGGDEGELVDEVVGGVQYTFHDLGKSET